MFGNHIWEKSPKINVFFFFWGLPLYKRVSNFQLHVAWRIISWEDNWDLNGNNWNADTKLQKSNLLHIIRLEPNSFNLELDMIQIFGWNDWLLSVLFIQRQVHIRTILIADYFLCFLYRDRCRNRSSCHQVKILFMKIKITFHDPGHVNHLMIKRLYRFDIFDWWHTDALWGFNEV